MTELAAKSGSPYIIQEVEIKTYVAVMSYPQANKTVINNLTSLKPCTVGHMTFIKYNAFCDSPKKELYIT